MEEYNDYIKELYKVIDKIEKGQHGSSAQDDTSKNQGGP